MAVSQASPKAQHRFAWLDHGENTLLSYEVETQIGGRLAQLGQRLIDGAARGNLLTSFLKDLQRP